MPIPSASAEQLQWERSCSPHIKSDAIWTLDVYRSGLFLLELARSDVKLVLRDVSRREAAAQLIDCVGGISGSVGEGYSRSTRADRLRFYSYALGSTRESVTWYLALMDLLGPSSTAEVRFALIERIRALMLGLIRSTRSRKRNTLFEE